MLVLAAAACGTTSADVGDDDAAISDRPAEVSNPLCDWPQQFGVPSHTGRACPAQHGLTVVAALVSDEDAQAENAFNGFLSIHEGAVVTSGSYVVMPHSQGWTDPVEITDPSTKTYDVQVFRWDPSVDAPNRALDYLYTLPASWEPVDRAVQSFGYLTNGYVQVFQPVVSGSQLYVPASSGRVERRDLATGALIATIDPFAGTAFSGDPKLTQMGALSISPSGKIYYTALAHPLGVNPKGRDARGAWLVEVDPTTNTARRADWSLIASKTLGIPTSTDQCLRPFFLFGRKPTGPDDHSNRSACGAQQPAMNSPVAFDGIGNIVALSYGTREISAAFLIRVSAATLAPIQAYDLRGRMLHGCGVRLAFDEPDTDCAIITANGTRNVGFDPDLNSPVGFQAMGLMDGSPTVAPNGDLAVSGYDSGFSFLGGYDSRGGTISFTASGALRAVNSVFGWEVTNAVQAALTPGGGFTYVSDSQLYSEFDLSIARWSPTFDVLSQARLDIQPGPAIDWLDTQVAINIDGSYCGVNGMGVFACFDGTGALVESVDLLGADALPYSIETLSNHISRDRAGTYYVNYGGIMWIIAGGGGGRAHATLAPTVGQAAQHALGRAAKAARARSDAPPALAELDVPRSDLVSIPDELRLVRPSSVCGIPTKCQPYIAIVNGNGEIEVSKAPLSDAICDAACGSLEGRCPAPNTLGAYLSCSDKCLTLGDFTATCIANCVNSIRTSCQTGSGNL